jgi:glycosyltransferase involved in cell wall biosynthesis
VCPRYYLVVDDQFCNLKCSIYNCRFINTVDYTNAKIEEWRIVWYNFLHGCCEIRCFSESTKTIFKNAYPAIDDKKLFVIPHDVSYCNFDPIVIDHSEFHIGIIGTCATVQKGCNIVRNFLKYMKNINIKITIIGRMHSWDKTPSKNINYINGYVRNELPGLIEKNHISAVLFPSICPETFSYLISELMLLKLPIVCFNCGAQAEKIRKYARGIICNNTNPKDILLSLQSAYDSLKRVYSCGNK